MTTKGKAQAYDKALEQAKKELRTDLHESGVWAIKRIFPELRESEDERIRKDIIEYLKLVGKGDGDYAQPIIDRWIAYLEKKKEPIDPLDTKLFQYGVKEGRRLEREDIMKEQQPAEWSDEDSRMLSDIVGYITGTGSSSGITKQERVDFLYGLSKRFNLQPKHEWSEEDETMINHIIEALPKWANGLITILPSQAEEYVKRLKFLRPQPKQGLSIEKAIQWFDDTFYFLDNSSGRGRDCEITTHDFDSLEEMYDSFRKAVIVDSEPSWKPSEEQMEVLKEASFYFGNSWVSHKQEVLESLYNDLKSYSYEQIY